MQLFPSRRGRPPKQLPPTVLYKTQLVRQVARATRQDGIAVQRTLTAVLDAVSQALARGDTVTLPGFGTFYSREQPQSLVRHIRTKLTVAIPAHRVAAFRVGDVLKRRVRSAKPNRGGSSA